MDPDGPDRTAYERVVERLEDEDVRRQLSDLLERFAHVSRRVPKPI